MKDPLIITTETDKVRAYKTQQECVEIEDDSRCECYFCVKETYVFQDFLSLLRTAMIVRFSV
mgnify:CR=1 FL=1